MPIKKKAVKKSVKAVKKAVKAPKVEKPIGIVTHFFGKINVAIVKFKKPIKVGLAIAFRGAHTDFSQKISSMQFDHQPITVAKKGKEVGIKVAKKVREGDEIFAA